MAAPRTALGNTAMSHVPTRPSSTHAAQRTSATNAHLQKSKKTCLKGYSYYQTFGGKNLFPPIRPPQVPRGPLCPCAAASQHSLVARFLEICKVDEFFVNLYIFCQNAHMYTQNFACSSKFTDPLSPVQSHQRWLKGKRLIRTCARHS